MLDPRDLREMLDQQASRVPLVSRDRPVPMALRERMGQPVSRVPPDQLGPMVPTVRRVR
jgi:hypothetical protein